MKYSEFVRKLNLGMVIKGFNIISSGSEQEINARADLLKRYIGTLEYEGKIIGVKPIATQEPDKLVAHWSLSELGKGPNDTFVFIDAYKGELQDKFNFKSTDDIDEVLADLNFKALEV